jgi:hypothetical protein
MVIDTADETIRRRRGYRSCPSRTSRAVPVPFIRAAQGRPWNPNPAVVDLTRQVAGCFGLYALTGGLSVRFQPGG